MRMLPLIAGFTLMMPLVAQAPRPAKARKPKPGATAPAAQPEAKPAPEAPAPAPAPKPKPRIRIDTSCGPIVVELEIEVVPKTVENFMGYVRSGHYKGTIFHRVINQFMIQGGGHLEDLTEKPTGPWIKNEADVAAKAGLLNTRGTIAMARLDQPDSATSQFYINTVDNTLLDHKSNTPQGMGYTPFGRVVEGMDVVDRISKVRTVTRRGFTDVPEYAVRIKEVVELPPAAPAAPAQPEQAAQSQTTPPPSK